MILCTGILKNYPYVGSIAVDSIPVYSARLINNMFAFEVSQSGYPLFCSHLSVRSWWHQFIGHGEHRLDIPNSKRVSIVYSGLFGLRRSVSIHDQIVSFPRSKAFSFLDTEWRLEGKKLYVTNVSDDLLLPIVGLSYFWLVRYMHEGSP